MYDSPSKWCHDQRPIDRDSLVIPEVLIEDLSCDVAATLRLAFDMIWNACGFPYSLNCNDDGKWEPR